MSETIAFDDSLVLRLSEFAEDCELTVDYVLQEFVIEGTFIPVYPDNN